MTASSIFKASLPSEARATNCTSEAGQDGIHRTAPPLISPPSAANQAHHVAAVCLLTTLRAKKVNSRCAGVDGNIPPACERGASRSCFWTFPQRAIALSRKPPQPPRHGDGEAAAFPPSPAAEGPAPSPQACTRGAAKLPRECARRTFSNLIGNIEQQIIRYLM